MRVITPFWLWNDSATTRNFNDQFKNTLVSSATEHNIPNYDFEKHPSTSTQANANCERDHSMAAINSPIA